MDHSPSLFQYFSSTRLMKAHTNTGEGNGNPLQHSCLENPVGGARWASVHGVTKSRTRLSDFTFMHWRRKWQPTPVFLPGESQGRWSLVGCCLWVAQSRTRLKWLSSSSSSSTQIHTRDPTYPWRVFFMRPNRAGDVVTSPWTNIHHWEKYMRVLMRVIWQPVRNTHSCPTPQTYWIRNFGGGAQWSVF